MKSTSRREFLGGIGWSMGAAAVGFALTDSLGYAATYTTSARERRLATNERLRFGVLDPLVDLMQATPADELTPQLVTMLRKHTSLADIVAAAALANARAYGGVNYNGYHALMAMMPSFEMAAQMPRPFEALPVLKVIHRNARFLQESGHAKEDALEPIVGSVGADANLADSIRKRDLPSAEGRLAALDAKAGGYEEIQAVVRDDMNVHRVVLAWRAYDLSRVMGSAPNSSLTLLRMPVRFCIDEDGQNAKRGQAPNPIKALLPELMEKHGLGKRERGTRSADAAWIEHLADVCFGVDRAAAASAVAVALADGIDPEDIGLALSLAATKLLLHDPGTTSAAPGKPIGTVHGNSVGVHASDAANAWRHIARIGSAQNAFASLIAGAYHTAGQSAHVDPLPHDHDGEPCTKKDPVELRGEIESKIRARDQKAACIATRRYSELGHSAADLFALLLPFAVSEDGALHAEKYFRTAQEEHAAARPEHKALFQVGLTRVMASHFGFPAPGCEEARKLLAS